MSLLSSKKAPSDCEAQCPDCGLILSRLADMNRHRKTKHPDGTEAKFPCPWFGCGYEATQKGNLKSHIDARHSDGPKFPCPECGRRFTDAAARIRHRKKMHGYVPYHTKEYLARQALNRKERVVQGASKAVSDKSRQQVDPVVPANLPNFSSSVPPPAPKLPEVAYHNDPNFSSTVPPLAFKFPEVAYLNDPNLSSTVPPLAPELPELAYLNDPNLSSSVPPLAPKLPELAYYNDFWNMPVDIAHSYPPQLFFPFESNPGYGTPNAIQNFPSAAQSQSPPSLPPSDFTMDYYLGSDLHGPQLYAMQSQEQQQFGEPLTGDHGMPPYNGNGPWNCPLPWNFPQQ